MRHNFVIASFFAFLTLLFTFPAVLNLTTRVMGGDGDSYQFLGFQNLGATLFYSGHFPFGWTDLWRYPFGINFQSSIDSSLFVILGVVLKPLIDNPILIYNLSVLTFLFLNLFLSFVSFRAFFPKLISIIGSVIYGASFYTLARSTGHVNLVISAGFLFSLYSFIRLIRENGSKKSLLLVFISLVFLSFTSLQYPLIFAASLPFVIVPFVLLFKNESIVIGKILWGIKYKLIATGLIFFLVFSLFHAQKIIDAVSGNLQLPTYDIVSVDPVNFFTPNSFLPTVSNFVTNESKSWIENSLFFGFVEIALFIFALFKLKDDSRNWFLITVTFLLFLISLGTQPFLSFIWPYQYLFSILPFRGIIEPGRFFVVYFIGFTFLILYFLNGIKSKWILLLILALLVLERIPKSYPLNQYIYTMNFVKYVNDSNSKAVLNLPLYYDHWNGAFYDYYSAFYNKPIVEGYIHWSGDTPYSKQLIKKLAPYTCQYQKFLGEDSARMEAEKILSILRKYQITTIVFHRYISYYNCEGPVKNMQVLFQSPSLRKIYEDVHSAVFEVQ